LVADTVSEFKTLEQSSGNQRPKSRQELSKFGEQELGPETQFWPTLATDDMKAAELTGTPCIALLKFNQLLTLHPVNAYESSSSSVPL